MNAATMQYGSDTGGAAATEALPAPLAPLHGAHEFKAVSSNNMNAASTLNE
jgi:hypothetical protein